MMPLTSQGGCGEQGRSRPASTREGEDEGMLSFLGLWKAQGLREGAGRGPLSAKDQAASPSRRIARRHVPPGSARRVEDQNALRQPSSETPLSRIPRALRVCAGRPPLPSSGSSLSGTQEGRDAFTGVPAPAPTPFVGRAVPGKRAPRAGHIP